MNPVFLQKSCTLPPGLHNQAPRHQTRNFPARNHFLLIRPHYGKWLAISPSAKVYANSVYRWLCYRLGQSEVDLSITLRIDCTIIHSVIQEIRKEDAFRGVCDYKRLAEKAKSIRECKSELELGSGDRDRRQRANHDNLEWIRVQSISRRRGRFRNSVARKSDVAVQSNKSVRRHARPVTGIQSKRALNLNEHST